MPDLLIEVGCEELPATYIAPALARLETGVRDALAAARLSAGRSTLGSSPRRLALSIRELCPRAASVEEELLGPPLEQAYKDGQPTQAMIGFARKLGLEPGQLGQGTDRKGRPCLKAVRRLEGATAAEVLARELPGILSGLPFPKSMRWPVATPERNAQFARPVRWLVCLLGAEVVPLSWAGLAAGRSTRGHPFLAPGPLELKDAEFPAYRRALEGAFVLVDPEVRRARIEEGLARIRNGEADDLRSATGGGAPDNRDLLDEVVNLVEWPTVAAGGFETSFLDLPPEVLREAMTAHQRYFPIADARGKLSTRFAVVLNRDAAQAPACIEGNERVLRARLTDARFFWDEDQKLSLEARRPLLEQMIFQAPLGSYAKKQERVSKLVDRRGEGLPVEPAAREAALQAAALAKTDLTTQMVGEFPSLQGIVGEAYALAQGLPGPVAKAIREQYMPRGAGDSLPETVPGALLALADRIDNLAASFVLGQIPTGAADPYQLRRQALAVLRIVRERSWSVRLDETLRAACEAVRSDYRPIVRKGREPEPALDPREAAAQAASFVRERLRQMFLDEGRAYDRVNAVFAAGDPDIAANIPFVIRRLDALDVLAQEPDWPALVEVVDRTRRIAKEVCDAAPYTIDQDPRVLTEPAEIALHEAWQEADQARRNEQGEWRFNDPGDVVRFARKYREALARPLHWFFEEVYVNVENPKLRAVRENRLKLLANINFLFVNYVADLSHIVLPGAKVTP